MPTRCRISGLSAKLRRELDARLVQSQFSGYVALAAWLSEHGCRVSKTTVGKYSKALRARLAARSRGSQATLSDGPALAELRAKCLGAAASQSAGTAEQTLRRASRYIDWVLTGR